MVKEGKIVLFKVKKYSVPEACGNIPLLKRDG